MDIYSAPLKDIPFAVLDVETTGFSPAKGARICEIAILKVRNLKEEEFFHSLVNPGISIPEEVKRIHNITDDMVKDYPYFFEIIPEVLRALEGACIVGHNINFDLNFLKNEIGEEFNRIKDNPVLDTLKLARLHLNQKSNSLENLSNSLGLGSDIFHRAKEDVIKTKNLLFHIIEFLETEKEMKIKTLSDLFEFQFIHI